MSNKITSIEYSERYGLRVYFDDGNHDRDPWDSWEKDELVPGSWTRRMLDRLEEDIAYALTHYNNHIDRGEK